MFTRFACDFFLDILKKLKGNYLEIGVYEGDALKELADAYPNKLIVGVDPFLEDGCTTHNSGVVEGGTLVNQRESALSFFKERKNILFFEMLSEQFLENLSDELIKDLNISAIFIDGSHYYSDVILDVKLALKLLDGRPGLICFDDMHVPEVLRAAQEFEQLVGDRIIDKVSLFNDACFVYSLKNE